METTRHKHLSLSARFSMSVIFVIAVSALLYLAWLSHTNDAFMKDKALAEARALNVEMQAVWEYIDQVQNAINYDSNGVFDFKGVYCSVAGKDIAQKFTRQSEGYVIRYARDNPRSYTDQPNEFEAEAIELFESTGKTEHYRMEGSDDSSYFLYASRIDITNNCLACHGEPVGEIDLTGFRKEGMIIGDLAGIASISIPMKLYESEMGARTVQSLAFFLCLAALVVVVVRMMLRKWVTEPLMNANDQLKSENEAKSDFLAMVSHELRTPLSSIIAYADILEGSPNEKTSEEKRYAKEIKESSAVLLDMVNNVIDTARFEAGKFEFVSEEVDMIDVVESVRATIESTAVRKDITLTMSVESNTPIVVCDGQALRIVITNLLSNAIKFTDAGGSVNLQAGYRDKGELLIVTVEDTGCGIAEHERSRIFERFVQSENARDRSTVGSGLGLALSKSLVNALGGKITVESEVGLGSQFSFEIPVSHNDGSSDEEE